MDTSDVQGELPSTSSNGEHQQFTRVNSILKKLKEEEYESIFKSSKITDDALDYINSKEEMRNILKDEKIPTGVAIKFTSIWFSSKTQAIAVNENASSETESHETSGADIAGISATKSEEHKSLEQDVLETKSKSETSGEKSQKSSVRDKQKTGRESVTEDTEALTTDVNSNVITKDKPEDTSHINTGTSSSEVNLVLQTEKQRNNLQDYKSETTLAEETGVPPLSAATQPKDHPKKTPNKTEDTPSAHEKKTDCDNGNGKTDSSIEVKKPFCSRKPFGTPVESFHYSKGNCFMVEENKEIEFKAFTNECQEKLPWKIMEKARPFICGILNAGGEAGTIYFGIGDSYDKTNNFSRGEIIGLEVEALKDEISKAFQTTLDDHIKSDDGKMKKGGDMNCVKIHFVPVTESGERTGHYVIEIETKRDWKFCKDHVYYCQQWTEKRGTALKRGLHDLYKINKDKWEDPTIRTCGSTATVKNVDIDKQIKEPLSQKYKEWQDEANRRQLKRMSSYDAGESIDAQKFSTDIRESLREINFKEISYILIANKVPPEYRGSNSLVFLQSIPWIAVFDLFDQNSKKDGLHFIFNETSDSARATVNELGDFKDLKPSEDMSTRGTTWILRSQSMHESDWTENSNHCLYQALLAYHEQSPTGRIHCVFLILSNEYLQEMANIIESCFSIIRNNANKCITIMSEKKEVGGEITKLLKPDVRRKVKAPCSIFGFPLDLLKENVRVIIGPTHFKEPGATTDLPHLSGKPRPVLNKRLNSLTDLEVYFPKPKLTFSVKEIEEAKENFYKGDVIKQLNLFHVHDIERTHKTELTNRIDKRLKRLSDPSEVVTRHVEIVTLSYESGSGATTLCRRILWDKRNTYRCAVVKTIGASTDYQIDELQKLLYETSSSFIPPVLVLLDNFPEHQVRHLQDKLSERKTKCVLLNTIPIAKLPKDTFNEVAPLGQLDNTEIERVKQILVDVKNIDDGQKEAAAKKVKRERRFIWLGLELFGRQYIDIEQRLSHHIRDIISHNLKDKLKDAYEMILRFCCLLDYYSKGRSIYPHPCAIDILYDRGGLDKNAINSIDKIHDKFGGLLLEEFADSEGYRGWRPAHFLVGEVVRKEMDLLATAKKLVKEMNTGTAYAKKYLTSDTVRVFLQREKKSDGSSKNQNEPDYDLDDSSEDDAFGSLEVQTRYSALTMDIMFQTETIQPDVTNALDLLLTLNENVTTTQHKARTWQQIARVFAYEIGMKKIPNEADPLVARIKKLICPGRDPCGSPTNGFDIAHLVIDEAIKLQESYVHHLVTKGAFYMAKLRDLREEAKHPPIGIEKLKEFIQEAITTSKKGIDVNDAALKKTAPDGYLHAMVGKIDTVIVLLEILKLLPFFAYHIEGPDKSFKDYMNFDIHPKDLRTTLSQEDLDYFISLKGITIQLSNDLFGEIKIRRTQSYKARKIQELTNAKIRAMNLRKRFYEVTGLDRTHLQNDTGYKEDIVYDLLFKYDETPYSAWNKLPPSIIAKFYESLKKAIPKETASHNAMLICARAALQQNVSVDELFNRVELWCQKYPRSVWAHLFKYMIHFPVPNLKANVPIVKSSVKVCKNLSRPGLRKSAAEYLLGKGVGLHSIIPAHEVSKDSIEQKTSFWRSRDVFENLERLCGQKILGRKGVLTYKGIEIVFDNERYPKESRDNLWFCLGFTVNGPYAYDPIEEDVYKEIQRTFFELKKKESSQPSGSARAAPSREGTQEKKMLTRKESSQPSASARAAPSPDPMQAKKILTRKEPSQLSASAWAVHSREGTQEKKTLTRKESPQPSASAWTMPSPEGTQAKKILTRKESPQPSTSAWTMPSPEGTQAKKILTRKESSQPSTSARAVRFPEGTQAKKTLTRKESSQPSASTWSVPSSREGTHEKKILTCNDQVEDNATSQTIPANQATGTNPSKLETKTTDQTKANESKTRINVSPMRLKDFTGTRTEIDWKSNPKLTITKRMEGSQDDTFTPIQIDSEGRVHHGAYVKRAPKSSECRTHTKEPVPKTCSFAHSWKGDHSLQTVCLLCTSKKKQSCDKINQHKKHNQNLGVYLNKKAETWNPLTDNE